MIICSWFWELHICDGVISDPLRVDTYRSGTAWDRLSRGWGFEPLCVHPFFLLFLPLSLYKSIYEAFSVWGHKRNIIVCIIFWMPWNVVVSFATAHHLEYLFCDPIRRRNLWNYTNKTVFELWFLLFFEFFPLQCHGLCCPLINLFRPEGHNWPEGDCKRPVADQAT